MSTASEIKSKFNSGWKISFFTIWGGQAFSLLGSSLVGFALVDDLNYRQCNCPGDRCHARIPAQSVYRTLSWNLG